MTAEDSLLQRSLVSTNNNRRACGAADMFVSVSITLLGPSRPVQHHSGLNHAIRIYMFEDVASLKVTFTYYYVY